MKVVGHGNGTSNQSEIKFCFGNDFAYFAKRSSNVQITGSNGLNDVSRFC